MTLQSERLISDVKILLNDVEELVKVTAVQGGEKVAEVRSRVQDTVNNLRPKLAELDSVVVERAKATAATADACLRENPWAAVGLSACLGLVIGMLAGRR